MSSTRFSELEASDVLDDIRTNIVRQLLDVEGWTDEVAADARAVRYLHEWTSKFIAADEGERESLIDDLLLAHEQAQQGLLSL